MGTTRGKKKHKRGKLKWSNRKANCGRKPAMGKRKTWATWREIRAKVLRRETVVVTPKKPAEAASE